MAARETTPPVGTTASCETPRHYSPSPRASPLTVVRLDSLDELKNIPKGPRDELLELPRFAAPAPEAQAPSTPRAPGNTMFAPIAAVTALQASESDETTQSPGQPVQASRLKMDYEKNAFIWHLRPIDPDAELEDDAARQKVRDQGPPASDPRFRVDTTKAEAADGEDEGADNDEESEASEPNRYICYEEELGSGAYKTVYRALNVLTGREVAWNELKLTKLKDKEKQRLQKELELLKIITHPNITAIYDSWRVTRDRTKYIIFITELMTSGTLKQYLRTFYASKPPQRPKSRVIKSWAKQILKGLQHLHTRNPPILHRDIKCDNIFIDGTTGSVKIGDLGLAIKKNQEPRSMIGTPEFMAPEIFAEREPYDEKVDVYAFGMAILEMLTGEYPYRECTSNWDIYLKVSEGIKPGCLAHLDRPKFAQARDFVLQCLKFAPSERASVKMLLKHPYLSKQDKTEQSFDQTQTTIEIDKVEDDGTLSVTFTKVTEDTDTKVKAEATEPRSLREGNNSKKWRKRKILFPLKPDDNVAQVAGSLASQGLIAETDKEKVQQQLKMLLESAPRYKEEKQVETGEAAAAIAVADAAQGSAFQAQSSVETQPDQGGDASDAGHSRSERSDSLIRSLASIGNDDMGNMQGVLDNLAKAQAVAPSPPQPADDRTVIKSDIEACLKQRPDDMRTREYNLLERDFEQRENEHHELLRVLDEQYLQISKEMTDNRDAHAKRLRELLGAMQVAAQPQPPAAAAAVEPPPPQQQQQQQQQQLVPVPQVDQAAAPPPQPQQQHPPPPVTAPVPAHFPAHQQAAAPQPQPPQAPLAQAPQQQPVAQPAAHHPVPQPQPPVAAPQTSQQPAAVLPSGQFQQQQPPQVQAGYAAQPVPQAAVQGAAAAAPPPHQPQPPQPPQPPLQQPGFVAPGYSTTGSQPHTLPAAAPPVPAVQTNGGAPELKKGARPPPLNLQEVPAQPEPPSSQPSSSGAVTPSSTLSKLDEALHKNMFFLGTKEDKKSVAKKPVEQPTAKVALKDMVRPSLGGRRGSLTSNIPDNAAVQQRRNQTPGNQPPSPYQSPPTPAAEGNNPLQQSGAFVFNSADQ